MKQIAVQLYTLRDRCQKDFDGVLKDVATIGYRGVETAGLYGKSPKELRRTCDELGLTVCSMHVALPTPDSAAEIADTARALGASMVVSGLGPDDFKSLDQIKAGAETFRTAAALLEPHGIRLGYHNHWWEFDLIKGRFGYDRFFELCPEVFGELDIYWACNFGKVDVPDFIAAHKAMLPLLHVKDGPLVQGSPHTAVGGGKMNIPACINAAGPKVLRWLIVELDECATDMTQAVRDSYVYLSTLE